MSFFSRKLDAFQAESQKVNAMQDLLSQSEKNLKVYQKAIERLPSAPGALYLALKDVQKELNAINLKVEPGS